MSLKPPPLPSEVLARVLRVATIEGYLLLFVAGGFAIQAAMTRDLVGALAACLAAGTGALEIGGVHALQRGDARGADSLVRAQVLLLAVILIYCAVRLAHPPAVEISVLPKWYRDSMGARGIDDSQLELLLRYSMLMTYVVFGMVSAVYQSSMAFYYHRRRDTIRVALDEEDASTPGEEPRTF